MAEAKVKVRSPESPSISANRSMANSAYERSAGSGNGGNLGARSRMAHKTPDQRRSTTSRSTAQEKGAEEQESLEGHAIEPQGRSRTAHPLPFSASLQTDPAVIQEEIPPTRPLGSRRRLISDEQFRQIVTGEEFEGEGPSAAATIALSKHDRPTRSPHGQVEVPPRGARIPMPALDAIDSEAGFAEPSMISQPMSDPLPESPELPAQSRVGISPETNVAPLRERSAASPRPRLEVVPRSLHQQAEYINQLATELETAIAELRDIDRRTQQRLATGVLDPVHRSFPRLRQADRTTLPQVIHINDELVLDCREVDFSQREQEALSTAQMLRHWVGRRDHGESVPNQSPPPTDLQIPRSRSRFPAAPSVPDTAIRSPEESAGWFSFSWVQKLLRVPPSFRGLINDAAAWILVAVGFRLGLQIVQALYPALLLPLVGLLALPLGLIAYHGVVIQKSISLVGYRLLLLIVGLLIGSRI